MSGYSSNADDVQRAYELQNSIVPGNYPHSGGTTSGQVSEPSTLPQLPHAGWSPQSSGPTPSDFQSIDLANLDFTSILTKQPSQVQSQRRINHSQPFHPPSGIRNASTYQARIPYEGYGAQIHYPSGAAISHNPSTAGYPAQGTVGFSYAPFTSQQHLLQQASTKVNTPALSPNHYARDANYHHPDLSVNLHSENLIPTSPGPRAHTSQARAEIDSYRPPSKRMRLSPAAADRIAVAPYPNEDAVAACALWKWKNPGRNPEKDELNFLSDLYGEDIDSICRLFGAKDDCGQASDQNALDPLTLSACKAWLRRNNGKLPHDAIISGFCLLFNESKKELTTWFTRNSSGCHALDDSAIADMTGTATKGDTRILNKFRRNREQCLMGRKSKGGRRTISPAQRVNLTKDLNAPYPCVTCGHPFKDAGSWKRHYGNNRIQVLWLCQYGDCANHEEECAWARKSQFRDHVEANHQEHIEDIDNAWMKIEKNHRRICIFKSCDTVFKSFKESCDHMCNHFRDNDWKGSDFREKEDEEQTLDAEFSARDDEEDHDPSTENETDDSDGDSDDPSLPESSSRQPKQRKRPPERGSRGSSKAGATSGAFYRTQNRYDACSESVMQIRGESLLDMTSISATKILRATHILSLKKLAQLVSPQSSKLDVIGRLGSGSRAVVHEVRFRGHKRTMACKQYTDHAHKAEQNLLREAEIMSRLQHPHVVELVTGYEEASCVALLMQPVANFNLAQYLTRCTFESGQNCDMWPWFYYLTTGLQHIHERGVRHKDIKPSNILVKDDNILISDFGSSDLIVNDKNSKLQSLEYTKLYAAPEVLKGERRTASDVFSLGCVFLEMATILLSKHKWKDMRLLQQQRHKATHSLHWAITWTEILHEHLCYDMTETKAQVLLHVCRTMINPSPQRRPTAAKVQERFNPRLNSWDLRDNPLLITSSKKSATWPLDSHQLRGLEKDRKHAGSFANIANANEVPSEMSNALGRMALTEISNPATDYASSQVSSQVCENHSMPMLNEYYENKMSTYLEEPDRYERFVVVGRTMSSNPMHGTIDPHLKTTRSMERGHVQTMDNCCFAFSNRANTGQPGENMSTPFILQHVMFSQSEIVIPLGNVSLDGFRTSTTAKTQHNSRITTTEGRKSSSAYWWC